jgi:hypothetical protein
MMLALLDGRKTTASPQAHTWGDAHCPHCSADVIAKCGPINAWHWAHKTADCDTWAEPDTPWHADWQEHFPPDSCEITIGNHRADVKSPTGLVIEFQHSPLSADEIRERENHYGHMLWVFDTVDAYETDRLNLRRRRHPAGGLGDLHDNYRSFRWKHPRRSLLHCARPVFLDLGAGQLLELKKLHPEAPYGGWGFLRTTDEFLQRCGLQFTFA